MPLLAIGLNHQTADVPIREQFSVSRNNLPQILLGLKKAGVSEVILLSTCNRTELYCVAEHSSSVIEALCLLCQVNSKNLPNIWYIYHDQAALCHLVSVATGLDSMILGEPQIFGQVKEAYACAKQAGTVGKILHQIFQHCFFLTKKIRSETNIGKNPVSIAFAATTLAKHIFAEPAECKVLLIGAGDTIARTAQHFHKQGVHQFYFVNRTISHAAHLAETFQAPVFELSELAHPLAEADIIVTATESRSYLISYTLLAEITKHNLSKPILLLDLSIPRNIDPDITRLADCYLYGIDDLQSVVLDNFEKRRDAAELAKEIIQHEVAQFFCKQKNTVQNEKIAHFTEHLAAMISAFEEDTQHMHATETVITAAKKLVRHTHYQTLKFLRSWHDS